MRPILLPLVGVLLAACATLSSPNADRKEDAQVPLQYFQEVCQRDFRWRPFPDEARGDGWHWKRTYKRCPINI